MEEKGFMISKQGLSLVRFDKKLITYITFLDQENLSRYKAMVYEEEALWKDLANTENPELSFELKQALYMKHCRNPEKTKAILRRYLLRICGTNLTEEQREDLLARFDDVIEETLDIEQLLKQEKAETRRIQMPDIKLYLDQMKKGK